MGVVYAALVRLSPDESVQWVTLSCADHVELGHVERDRYTSDVSGNAYVTGLEVIAANDIVYASIGVEIGVAIYEL